jgi:hypothetical protein
MREEHCGCGLGGIRQSPFGPKDFWYRAMTWWLGSMLALREPAAAMAAERWAQSAECIHGSHLCTRAGQGSYPLHRGMLSSPLGFMFGIDRESALSRSRDFLEAQYRLCKVGLRTMPYGWSGAPRAAWLPSPGMDYNPLVYGHVNERLPYFLFGHEFVERPVPDCIWVGDHATMNCSQPFVQRQVARGSDRTDPNSLAEELGLTPVSREGCKASVSSCGSTIG